MPGHPKIYSEAIKLTLRVTHSHKTPPRSWDGRDPAMCSQGHSFAKFIKVRYCFVLLLNKGSQTVCSSGPTTWIHPCTSTPPNPIQSDSGMWSGHQLAFKAVQVSLMCNQNWKYYTFEELEEILEFLVKFPHSISKAVITTPGKGWKSTAHHWRARFKPDLLVQTMPLLLTYLAISGHKDLVSNTRACLLFFQTRFQSLRMISILWGLMSAGGTAQPQQWKQRG